MGSWRGKAIGLTEAEWRGRVMESWIDEGAQTPGLLILPCMACFGLMGGRKGH